MERIYYLPVRVKIDSDNPDRVMRGIAETINNAVEAYTGSRELETAFRRCVVEYSIYIKADGRTFGQE